MRKTFLVAGVATLALGTAGIAYAQTPAPTIDATASVSPTKAGTKSKPKSQKFTLKVKNSAESKTTASSIKVTLPSTLKLNTKGLDQCKASDSELIGNINTCRKSIAGKGTANAVLNPFATNPGPLKFNVQVVIAKNELLFVLSGAANAVLHGKIKGRSMTIAIPDGSGGQPNLQMPITGAYSALLDLSVSMSKKKGKNALITSSGCRSGSHGVAVQVDYVPNPNPPAASNAKDTAEAKCS